MSKITSETMSIYNDLRQKEMEAMQPPQLANIINDLDSHLTSVLSQRDSLLAALRDCETSNGATAFVHPKYAPQRLRAINEIVRAAIAQVEKGTNQ